MLGELPQQFRSLVLEESLLAFARTPFAIDRLVDLGASPDRPDTWGVTPVEAMSRLGCRGGPLIRHLQTHGSRVAPRDLARLGRDVVHGVGDHHAGAAIDCRVMHL